MNCEACEKQMYLFSELTPEQKHDVEVHLAGCPACSAQFSLLQESATLIQHAALSPVLPQNRSQLTSRIMERVHRDQVTPVTSWMMRLMDMPLLRYALVTASLVIMLEFVAEQQLPNFSEQQSKTTTSHTIILDTKQFLKKVQERRTGKATEKNFSLLEHIKNNQTKRF